MIHLEEENIKLFIEKAEELFKIENIFGHEKEKVFQDFDNFYLVLNGIAQLSLKIADSKLKLKPRKSGRNKSSVQVKSTLQVINSRVHQVYENLDSIYDYMYDNYDTEKKGKKDTKPNNLKNAVLEFINSHELYRNNCLLNMKENYIEKCKDEFLNHHFFPRLKIDVLHEIHSRLSAELTIFKYDYKRIGSIFETFEQLFLKYSQVLPKMSLIIDFLEDKLAFNPGIREEVSRLTKESKNTSKNMNRDTLQDTLLLIPQHVMRYNLYLEILVKKAGEVGAREVQHQAKKSHDIMKNVLDHLNSYTRDYNMILASDCLEHMYDVEGLKECDKMFLNLPDIKAFIKNDKTNTFKNYHLYVFEEKIVAFELVPKEEYRRDKEGNLVDNWFGGKKKRTVTKHEFKETFKFEYGYEIKLDEKEQTIEMNTYDNNMQLNENKSLKIKFSIEDDLKETFKQITDLHDKSTHLKNLKGGSEHNEHDFEIFKNEITTKENAIDHVKCGECTNYLGGKILKGVYCTDCNKHYHINCFEYVKEIYDDPEEYMETKTG